MWFPKLMVRYRGEGDVADRGTTDDNACSPIQSRARFIGVRGVCAPPAAGVRTAETTHLWKRPGPVSAAAMVAVVSSAPTGRRRRRIIIIIVVVSWTSVCMRPLTVVAESSESVSARNSGRQERGEEEW